MVRAAHLIAAACLCAHGLVATRAAATGVALDYEVRYGLFEVLEVSATTRLDDGRYETTSTLRTVGIVGLLFPWNASARTNGLRNRDELRPLRHRAEGTYRSARRTVALDYDPTGGIHTQILPPAATDYRDPVPPGLLPGTIDPLTASLAAVELGCHGTLRVFDGRRRYDMTLEEYAPAPVPSERGVYQGTARHCRATIAPLAGFWRPTAQADERPTHLDFWVATPRPDLLAVPVYLELSAPRGTLGVHLTRAEALP